jgi:hypothetical protein
MKAPRNLSDPVVERWPGKVGRLILGVSLTLAISSLDLPLLTLAGLVAHSPSLDLHLPIPESDKEIAGIKEAASKSGVRNQLTRQMTQRGSQRSMPRRRRKKSRRRRKRSNGAMAQRCFTIRREKDREYTKQRLARKRENRKARAREGE